MAKGSSNQSGLFLSKPQVMRYSFNWYVELQSILGVYTFFMRNRQYERAWHNLHDAVLHVYYDKQQRVFLKKHPVTGELTFDEELAQEFLRYKNGFEETVGFPGWSSPDGKFTYLELKPRERPEPAEDRVWISRFISLFDFWGKYDYDYLVHKIRYVVVQNKHNQMGFPIQVEKALFSFQRKDILDITTNAMPYAPWEQEVRAVIYEIKQNAKPLELILSGYLEDPVDRKGGQGGGLGSGLAAGGIVPISVGEGGAMVQQQNMPELGMTDTTGGFNYGPLPGRAAGDDAGPRGDGDREEDGATGSFSAGED